MSDPIQQTPAPTMAPTATQTAIIDVGLTFQEFVKLRNEYKASGLSGITKLGTEAFGVIKQDVADIEAAIPEVKSGFKTSEFWLNVVGGITIVYPAVMGHPLPTTVTMSIAALIGVYNLVRGALKK